MNKKKIDEYEAMLKDHYLSQEDYHPDENIHQTIMQKIHRLDRCKVRSGSRFVRYRLIFAGYAFALFLSVVSMSWLHQMKQDIQDLSVLKSTYSFNEVLYDF